MLWLDVTMPATLRPEIVARTLQSFRTFVKWSGKRRLVLNIDQVPSTAAATWGDVVAAATGDKWWDEVRINVSSSPSFTRAVMWCWGQVDGSVVLHLEDDWEFTRDVDIDRLFAQYPEQYVRLPKEGAARLDKIALQPSLFPVNMVEDLLRVMTQRLDPEKQLRYGVIGTAMDGVLDIWAGKDGSKLVDAPDGPYCRDIGREWREKRGLQKWNKNIPGDITWSTV